ncbi:MAG: M2 family metallopeptidase, partial [Novosphingobium sp.]|nr:M2 family metallopeptidase [Novosphingobium sp.]
MKNLVSLGALALSLAAAPAFAEEAAPTREAAEAFVDQASKDFLDQLHRSARTEWIYSTYITDDTAAINAEQEAVLTQMQVGNALTAAKYADVKGLDYDTDRILARMRTALVSPAATTPGAADELAETKARIQGIYGKGKGTLNGQPINGSDIEAAMGSNRNPAELKEMWSSWHDNVGAGMKGDYARMVELMNGGAQELGYRDLGDLWRSNYDMDPEAFAALTEKIWQEVKPLYSELHCYTRTRLNEKYGDEVQPATGPIRADLLGNMWAQEWGNIYDVVAPPGAGDLGYDLTDLLKANDYDAIKMVKAGENFFSSLGFEPLPETFWTRSQFVKPADREVICHASAWDLDNVDDLRIKMCIKINADDFTTVHHELGHNYYQRAY